MKVGKTSRAQFIYNLLNTIKSLSNSIASIQTSIGNLTTKVNELSSAAEKSHIGMIIQSTTLDTEAKVKEIYGGTKWVKIEGRMLIGSNSSYTINSTGGSSTITLSIANLPGHTHTVGAHSHGLNSHTHSIPALSGSTNSTGSHTHSLGMINSGSEALNYGLTYGGAGFADRTVVTYHTNYLGTWGAGDHSHTVTTNASTTGASSGSTANSGAFASGSTGSGTAFSIIPPYKAVYIWERTA